MILGPDHVTELGIIAGHIAQLEKRGDTPGMIDAYAALAAHCERQLGRLEIAPPAPYTPAVMERIWQKIMGDDADNEG